MICMRRCTGWYGPFLFCIEDNRWTFSCIMAKKCGLLLFTRASFQIQTSRPGTSLHFNDELMSWINTNLLSTILLNFWRSYLKILKKRICCLSLWISMNGSVPTLGIENTVRTKSTLISSLTETCTIKLLSQISGGGIPSLSAIDLI